MRVKVGKEDWMQLLVLLIDSSKAAIRLQDVILEKENPRLKEHTMVVPLGFLGHRVIYAVYKNEGKTGINSFVSYF